MSPIISLKIHQLWLKDNNNIDIKLFHIPDTYKDIIAIILKSLGSLEKDCMDEVVVIFPDKRSNASIMQRSMSIFVNSPYEFLFGMPGRPKESCAVKVNLIYETEEIIIHDKKCNNSLRYRYTKDI